VIKLLDYDKPVQIHGLGPRSVRTQPTWTARTFNDSSWPSGQALLALRPRFWASDSHRVEDPASATTSGSCHLLRAHFSYPFSGGIALLTFTNRIDDAAVFYLNGLLVQRVRLIASQTTHTGLGTPSSEATVDDVFTIVAPIWWRATTSSRYRFTRAARPVPTPSMARSRGPRCSLRSALPGTRHQTVQATIP